MKILLILLVTLGCYSFDGMEVEQLMFSSNQEVELDKLIKKETDSNDLKLLKELKRIYLTKDFWEFNDYIKTIMSIKEKEIPKI